ncbi:kinase-like protein [Neoconidiobolus thromboides FSU 785]|nr:kinase-like protein [Neoconidiobolus thromboides FSU 785]
MITAQKDSAINLMHKCVIFLANIDSSVDKLKHNSSIREALAHEIKLSKQYIQSLIEIYPKHHFWFEQILFYSSIQQYMILLDGIHSCLIALSKSGRFIRIINKEQNNKVIIQWLSEMQCTTQQLKQITLVVEQMDQNNGSNDAFNDNLRRVRDTFNSTIHDLKKISTILDSATTNKTNIIKDIDGIKGGCSNDLKKYEIEKEGKNEDEKVISEKGSHKLILKRYRGKPVMERRYKGISKEILLKLKKEAAMVGRLSECESIIKIHGLWINSNETGLIMDYCSNGNLKQIISNNNIEKTLSLKFKWMKQLLEVVDYLHELNIIHRNLNLNHLLFDDNYDLKLSGFEFSKEYNLHHTNLGMNKDFSEFIFMPPESFKQKYVWSFKGDIYSIGLLLWSIYAERTPFGELHNPSSIASFSVNPKHENLSQFPDDLAELISEAWNFEPNSRPGSDTLVAQFESIYNKMFKEKQIENDFYGLDTDGIIELTNTKLFWTKLNPEASLENSPRKKIIEHQKEAKNKMPLLVRKVGNGPIDITVNNITRDLKNSSIRSPEIESYKIESIERDMERAIDYHQNSKKPQAYKIFQGLAMYGDIQAFYYLGTYHYWGYKDICKKDIEKAINYMELSAASGHSKALDFLGNHYYQLAQSKENNDIYYQKAVHYFDQAVQLGDKSSLYHLGTCYIKGQGVKMDIEKGLQLVNQAAKFGNIEAKKALMSVELHSAKK